MRNDCHWLRHPGLPVGGKTGAGAKSIRSSPGPCRLGRVHPPADRLSLHSAAPFLIARIAMTVSELFTVIRRLKKVCVRQISDFLRPTTLTSMSTVQNQTLCYEQPIELPQFKHL